MNITVLLLLLGVLLLPLLLLAVLLHSVLRGGTHGATGVNHKDVHGPACVQTKIISTYNLRGGNSSNVPSSVQQLLAPVMLMVWPPL